MLQNYNGASRAERGVLATGINDTEVIAAHDQHRL